MATDVSGSVWTRTIRSPRGFWCFSVLGFRVLGLHLKVRASEFRVAAWADKLLGIDQKDHVESSRFASTAPLER